MEALQGNAELDLDSLLDLLSGNDQDFSNNLTNQNNLQNDNKSSGSNKTQIVDLFSNATTEPEQVIKNAASIVHTGDTSSEDEDTREHLTETGQLVKKKIAIKKYYESKKEKPKTSWTSTNESISNSKLSSLDSLTGVRIVNPVITFNVMDQRMKGRKLIKMSFLDNHLRKGDIDGDWVTVGVIARKIPPKTSRNGNIFSIWKLTDLHNPEKFISLFLFSQVHKEHWKLSVGTVIGLLNPSKMASNDKNEEFSISLDHPGKLMVIGTSKDFGHCKGKRKDGERCNMVVNLSQCEFCVFHVKSEYKKFSRRTEIQAAYSGREPNVKTSSLKGQTYFYGGQIFVPLGKSTAKKTQSVTSKDKMTLSNLTMKRKASQVFNEEKGKSIKKLAEMYGDDISKAAMKNSDFINNRLVIPSAGSKQFLHMMKSSIAKKEDNTCIVSPKDLMKQHENQLKLQLINKKTDSEILYNLMPQLGKGLSPGQNVSFAFSSSRFKTEMTAENYAKLKAINKIKANGPIEKKNPNCVKSKPDQRRIEAILNTTMEKNIEPVSEDGVILSRGRLGTIDLNSEKIQKILNQKSSHAYEVEMAEMEKEAAYFSRLEKKEQMQEKMCSTTEIVCDVVSCKQCRYTAHSAADRCKTESHPLKCHKAIKRFYACKDCNKRTACFTRFPLKACFRCGSSNYQRSGMARVPSGIKLDSEILNISCDDALFLNSL